MLGKTSVETVQAGRDASSFSFLAELSDDLPFLPGTTEIGASLDRHVVDVITNALKFQGTDGIFLVGVTANQPPGFTTRLLIVSVEERPLRSFHVVNLTVGSHRLSLLHPYKMNVADR